MPRSRLRAADRNETRRRTSTRAPRKPREPRLSKGPSGDHQYNDTIRVLTDKGAVEYTEATYQVSVGSMLVVYGRRDDGKPFIAALYNSNSWGGVITIPRPVATPEPVPAGLETPAP